MIELEIHPRVTDVSREGWENLKKPEVIAKIG